MSKLKWRCFYTSGVYFNQINDDGTKNAYKDIDRDNLKYFELWDDTQMVLRVKIEKDQRLIWRRINFTGARSESRLLMVRMSSLL
jgi:hypothetical protein